MAKRKEAPAPLPLRHPRAYSVVAPEFAGPALRELLAAPDAFFDRPDTVIIKDSARSTVARGWVGATEVVVKRTNPRSWWKALKRAFAPSRAARAWHAGRRLRALGVDTPEPLTWSGAWDRFADAHGG